MALEVTPAGESMEDINAGIIEDESFGLFAHFLANTSQQPMPPTVSTKEHKLWIATQRFYLEGNGLLWLCGDLEKKEVKKKHKGKEEGRRRRNKGKVEGRRRIGGERHRDKKAGWGRRNKGKEERW
jgi:hypothetical protein